MIQTQIVQLISDHSKTLKMEKGASGPIKEVAANDNGSPIININNIKIKMKKKQLRLKASDKKQYIDQGIHFIN